MQPKRKQGPLAKSPTTPPVQRKPSGPSFKAGDYVPLAIIVLSNGRPTNVHLPVKLFALQDLKQADMLNEYHFQHPQQPVLLDPQNPNIAAFNGAVTNFHKWCVAKGYCRAEGSSNLTVHIWTEEEMVAARKEEAELREQILSGNLSDEAKATLKAAGLDLSDIQLEPAVTQHVNVGTVGHVDHGQPVPMRSVSDGGRPFEGQGNLVDEEVANFVAQARETHPLDQLLTDDRGAAPADIEPTTERVPDDLERMYPHDAQLLDIHNNDVAKSYPGPAISAAELIAADPKGGL